MPSEPIRKRNRQVLVCNNCHKKKRKCDRNIPCKNCIKSKLGDTCQYENNPPHKQQRLKENNVISKELHPRENGSKLLHRQEIEEVHKNRSIRHESENNEQEDDNQKISGLKNKEHRQNEQEYGQRDGQIEENRTCEGGLRESLEQKMEYLCGRIKVLEECIKSRNTKDEVDKKENLSNMVASEQLNLTFIGINPFGSEDQRICMSSVFHGESNGKSRMQVSSLGILRFLVLLRQDPCGNLVWKYLMSPALKKHPPKPEINIVDYQRASAFYKDSFINKIEKVHSDSDINDVKGSISKFGMSLGLTFHHDTLQNRGNLLDRVNELLPNRKTIQLLVNVFFDVLYNHFPILDEKNFRSEVFRILGDDINDSCIGKPKNIDLANMHDLAILSSLLVLLRLSYLSLFSYHTKINTDFLMSENLSKGAQDKKYLLNHPIPLDIIDVAELCLKELNLISEPSLEVFQALALLQIYHTYAPEEDSFRRFDSVVSIGVLHNMAVSLFLNRDPENLKHYVEQNGDEKLYLLRRNLWLYLVGADIENSIIYGTPIHTISHTYDTKPPYLPSESSNISIIERKLIYATEKLNPVFNLLHTIVEVAWRIDSCSVPYLLSMLSDFEKLITDTLGKFNDYLVVIEQDNYDFLKIQKFKLLLYSKLMLLYIYYGLYLYYEKQSNIRLSFFYLKKLVSVMFYELAGFSEKFIHLYDTFFGSSSSLVLGPVFQAMSRMMIALSHFLIRANCTKRSTVTFAGEDTAEKVVFNLYRQSLQSIIDILVKFEHDSVNITSALSNRYYFAWRSASLSTPNRSIVTDDFLYSFDEESVNSTSLKFSQDEVRELANFLSACLNMKTQVNNALSDVNRNVGTICEEDNLHQDISPSDQSLFQKIQINNLWTLIDILRQEALVKHSRKLITSSGSKKAADEQSIINTDSTGAESSLNYGYLQFTEHNDIYQSLLLDEYFFDNGIYNSYC